MRYLAILLTAVGVALIAVGTGVSAQARHVPIHIDDHFEATDLSAACGFDVFIDVVADLKVTLVYNKSGLVAREIDTAGGGTITYRSPDTGKSFSFMYQPSQWDYGSGAVLGSSVIVSFTGLQGHATGFIDSDAGLFRFEGVVTSFEDGVPFVDFVDVIADRGNRNSGEEITAAICAALTDQ
jgi:hypothetical protein